MAAAHGNAHGGPAGHVRRDLRPTGPAGRQHRSHARTVPGEVAHIAGVGMSRVLVAGDGGYIGAVLVPFMRAAGHEVAGLDLGLYEGCDLGPASASVSAAAWRRGIADIREITPDQLAGYDAVICLAALSNDPLGDLNPSATYSVNLDGTLHLARAAREAGVPRFLFSSSCSLYGASGS